MIAGFSENPGWAGLRSVPLGAHGGEELLELLQAPDERVTLGRERRELPLAEGVALILLRDPRLELRLPLVKVLQLGLEAGHALLGRKVADEQHVQDQQQKNDAGQYEEQGNPRGRTVSHGLGF